MQPNSPFIPLRTFGSRIGRWFHTWLYQSCTCEQSQAQEDHLDLGQSARSKWRAAPEIYCVKVTETTRHLLQRSKDSTILWSNGTLAISTQASNLVTLEIVNAGLHCSLRMSRQMLPLLFMFGWKTFVLKETCKTGRTEFQQSSFKIQ